MKKTCVIEQCNDCPFFDNEYYDFAQTCSKLNRKIDVENFRDYPMPVDCPLPDFFESTTSENTFNRQAIRSVNENN